MTRRDKTWNELMNELPEEDRATFEREFHQHFDMGTLDHPALPIDTVEEIDLQRARAFLSVRGVNETQHPEGA